MIEKALFSVLIGTFVLVLAGIFVAITMQLGWAALGLPAFFAVAYLVGHVTIWLFERKL